MKIETGELRKHKGRDQEIAGLIPALHLDYMGNDLEVRDIRITGMATNTGDSIYVRGKAEAVVELTCSLCLTPFQERLQFAFEENYYREGEEADKVSEELGRSYSGDEIDLNEVIQEGLLLALPMKALCQAECRGLCPICGCNRNFEQCNCSNESLDPRLAVLKDLLKDQD